METDLYRIRSLAHCTKAAYDLFASNLRQIVRRTWLPFAVLAAVVAVGQAVLVTLPVLETMIGGHAPGAWGLALGCLGTGLALLAASTWADAAVAGLLNGAPLGRNLPRMARLVGLMVLVWLVVMVATSAVSMLPLALGKPEEAASGALLSTGVALLLFVVAGAALLPMAYSATKYYMEPAQRIGSVLGKPYRRGWRHWGLLFSAALLTAIIAGLVGMVVTMPVHIVQLAHWANAQGLVLGDADGMPPYSPLLAFAASMVCTFVYAYVMVWVQMVFYYIYGSIEARHADGHPAAKPQAPATGTPAVAPPADINLQ